MPDLLVHGLEVTGGGAAGGVHPLLDTGAALVGHGDLCLEVLLGRHQVTAARRQPGLLRGQCGQLGLERDQPDPLGQRHPAMLELGDQRVQVLHGQEPVERAVTHADASHSARAIGKAAARASSAIADASSHANQRASGLSPGGGCGSSAAPIKR